MKFNLSLFVSAGFDDLAVWIEFNTLDPESMICIMPQKICTLPHIAHDSSRWQLSRRTMVPGGEEGPRPETRRTVTREPKIGNLA
jgi:hypothetical protein